ncbi:hypothetical protein [Flavobacterium coralii]|uniref:hypothetical protein n=1 Tax=Flavobacterium coralii TaxID=2838017 RepID=UPI0026788147|tara:strand:- start:1630 stop:1788 length:159 start_codon:yes stop_codon:yes gene_type:complete
MENLEGLNEIEFKILLEDLEELSIFMSDTTNVLLLDSSQYKRAKQALNKYSN